MTPSELLDLAWSYPLFEALYGRRSRRFGLGFEMPEGPFRYKSAHAPVPLSEIEEALLVGAGAGFSGLRVLGSADAAALPSPQRPHIPDDARPAATPRCSSPTTKGFMSSTTDVAASKLREIETPDERTKLLEAYRAQRRELRRGRLDIPRRVPPMSGHDLWDSNRPGSTLFLPVCDVSASLISLIAQFVDPALRRYAPAGGGMNIVDDRHGNRPAGTERWLKERLPRCRTDAAAVDRRAAGLLLRLQRAGGDLPEHVPGNRGSGARRMEALRISLARNSRAHGLPHRRGERREQHSAIRSGSTACSRQAVRPITRPWMQPSMPCLRRRRAAARKPDPCRTACRRRSIAPARSGSAPEGLACTKAICNYILDTYGRFPGGTDAMHLMWVMQAHHIDTDYYDRFFGPGAYGPAHATHMATWHP